MATLEEIKKQANDRRPDCEFPGCSHKSDGYARAFKQELCNMHRKMMLTTKSRELQKADDEARAAAEGRPALTVIENPDGTNTIDI